MVRPPIRSIIHSRTLGVYLSLHANKPSSISHITLYQRHSVESTLIQGYLNIVCPLGMLPIKIQSAYGEETNLEEESIVCLGEVEMNTFLQELLSFE